MLLHTQSLACDMSRYLNIEFVSTSKILEKKSDESCANKIANFIYFKF